MKVAAISAAASQESFLPNRRIPGLNAIALPREQPGYALRDNDLPFRAGSGSVLAHRAACGCAQSRQPSQPAASCFSWAAIALRMKIATVTGPTPPGTGVTQLAISLTSSVSTSPTIVVSPLGPVT